MCGIRTLRHYANNAASSRSSTAIADLVHDGDTVALEGFTHLIPVAAGHEVIRQRRRDLTLVRMTPDIVYDQLIGAGCARKLVFSWGGNPGVGSLHRFRDAIQNALAGAAGDRGAQPRRARQPLRRRRLRAAVRGHARLPRHRPARAHRDDRADHVPVHRRAADRGAGARARRRDRPRAARRPRGQRADVGADRRAEGGGARGQALARHRRGDRRRARAAPQRRRAAELGRDLRGRGAAAARIPPTPTTTTSATTPTTASGTRSARTATPSARGWRSCAKGCRRELDDRRDDERRGGAGAARRRRLLRRHRAAEHGREPRAPHPRARSWC